MSKQDLIKVVQRSISDAAFRRQLTTDANSALRGYSLTPEEIGALRSRDAGKLSAFGVDTRMSKVFTIDQGALGNATITAGEQRDNAPVWIGDGAAHGAVQTPDAAERNAAIIGDPQLAVTSVQSPDAVDRNAAYASGDASAIRNTEPTWIGDTGAGKVAPVEGSPEESAYNASLTGGSNVRDDAPVWVGDLGAATGAVQSPDAMDRNEAFTGAGAEPRDSEPVWIGDTQGDTKLVYGDGFDGTQGDGLNTADTPEHLSTGDGDVDQ
jgi:hypothetical protein